LGDGAGRLLERRGAPPAGERVRREKRERLWRERVERTWSSKTAGGYLFASRRYREPPKCKYLSGRNREKTAGMRRISGRSVEICMVDKKRENI